jgi:hypothetical protein
MIRENYSGAKRWDFTNEYAEVMKLQAKGFGD